MICNGEVTHRTALAQKSNECVALAQISMAVLWHRPAPICEGKGLLFIATARRRLAMPWHRLDKLCEGFAVSSAGIDWHGLAVIRIAKALEGKALHRRARQRL